MRLIVFAWALLTTAASALAATPQEQAAIERVHAWARSRLQNPDQVITHERTARIGRDGIARVRIVWTPTGRFGERLRTQERCYELLPNGTIRDLMHDRLMENIGRGEGWRDTRGGCD